MNTKKILVLVTLLALTSVTFSQVNKPELIFESGESAFVGEKGDNVFFSTDSKFLAIHTENEIRIYDNSSGLLVNKVDLKYPNGNITFSDDFNYFKYSEPGYINPIAYIYETFKGKEIRRQSAYFTFLDKYIVSDCKVRENMIKGDDTIKVYHNGFAVTKINSPDTFKMKAQTFWINQTNKKVLSIWDDVLITNLKDLNQSKLKCVKDLCDDFYQKEIGTSFWQDDRYILFTETSQNKKLVTVVDSYKDAILLKTEYSPIRYSDPDYEKRLFDYQLTFEPKTGWLSIASNNGLKLYNIFSKKEIALSIQKEKNPIQLTLSRNDHLILWTSEVVKIYDLKKEAWIKSVKGANLSAELNPQQNYLYVKQNGFNDFSIRLFNLESKVFTDSLEATLNKISPTGEYILAKSKTYGSIILNNHLQQIRSLNTCTPITQTETTDNDDFIVNQKQGTCDFNSDKSYFLSDFSYWNLSSLEKMECQFPKNRVRNIKSLDNLTLQNKRLLYRDINKIRCLSDSLFNDVIQLRGDVESLNGRFCATHTPTKFPMPGYRLPDTTFFYENFKEKYFVVREQNFIELISIDTINRSLIIFGDQEGNYENKHVSVYDFEGKKTKDLKIKLNPTPLAERFNSTISISANDEFIVFTTMEDYPERERTQFYNLKSGRQILEAVHKPGTISTNLQDKKVAFSKDDTLHIASLQTGKLLKKEKGKTLCFNQNLYAQYTLTGAGEYGQVLPETKKTISVLDWSTNKTIFKKEIDSIVNFVKCAAISKNQKLFVFPTYKNSILLYDLVTGKQLAELKGHSNEINSIAFLAGDQLLISNSHDGSSKIWSVKEGKEKIALYDFYEDGYIITTPEGYYKASKNALSKFGYKIQDRVFTSSQFDLQFNRPDIVLNALGKTDTTLLNAYERAYEKRIQRSKFKAIDFTKPLEAPEVTILNKEKIPIITEQQTLNLTIRCTNKQGILESYNILINGVPILGEKGAAFKNSKDSIELSLSITLSAGINRIHIKCKNKMGVESLPETITTTYVGISSNNALTYFIGIGVSDYKDSNYKLNYADKDVLAMDSVFKNKLKNITSFLLTNKEATRENILALKKRLLRSQPDDNVIVSFSGHGVIDENYDFYLGTYDMNFKTPKEKGLSYNDLKWLLDSIPSRKKLALIDACQSGELDKDDLKQLDGAKNHPIDTNVRASRGAIAIIPSKLGLTDSFQIMKELFADIENGNGTSIISAAAGNQFAYEGREWKNGVFTYSILQALDNANADLNFDGNITISELQAYTSNKVKYLTIGKQQPTSRQINLENDWIIWTK